MARFAPYELMVRVHPDDPSRFTAVLRASFFAKGNASLPIDPARPVQLRACLPHEKRRFDPVMDVPGRAVLIRRERGALISAHTVVVDPKCMDDTPANVEAAIDDFGSFFPMQAFELRRAVRRAADAAARAAASAANEAADTPKATGSTPGGSADLFAASRSRRSLRRKRNLAGSQKGGPRQARPSA